MITNYEKPKIFGTMYGEIISSRHAVYSSCTLYKIGNKGLAVIQQRYDPETKHTWWSSIDAWLTDDIYTNECFKSYFDKYASEPSVDDIYPTVTIRQIMHALKMKPLKKEVWETVFDSRIKNTLYNGEIQ